MTSNPRFPGQVFILIDKLDNVAEYHVENFGCRASQADGGAIAAGLRSGGLNEAVDLKDAAIVVLNTCSVTAEAERSARAYLRRVRRVNSAAKVLITGCYAQRVPSEVAALDGVHAVVGNSHKSLSAEAALSLLDQSRDITAPQGAGFVPLGAIRLAAPAEMAAARVWHDPDFAHFELAALPLAAADAHQTRPNLKVQDGCGNRCSFCIIPTTRGPSRSLTMAAALEGVREFVAAGGQEMVLSGINLGRWGRDLAPPRRLEELISAIFEETTLPRLRISSVEPMDWSSELIGLFRRYGTFGRAAPRLARHVHLPLQSGSDAVLRWMHRRYRPWHYAGKVEELHGALPDAAIGADVMVGFPGETDALFLETYHFIERLPFTYLHIFPFSARPGTAAFREHQQNPVSPEAVKERKGALRALILRKNKQFRQTFLGRELSVVTLAGGECGEALSDNFVKVCLEARHLANQMLRVQVIGLSDDGVAARVMAAG